MCCIHAACISVCTRVCVGAETGSEGKGAAILFCLCRHVSGPPAQPPRQQRGCKTLPRAKYSNSPNFLCHRCLSQGNSSHLFQHSVSTKTPVPPFSKCTKHYLQNTLSFIIIQPVTAICLYFWKKKSLSFPLFLSPSISLIIFPTFLPTSLLKHTDY